MTIALNTSTVSLTWVKVATNVTTGQVSSMTTVGRYKV